MGKSTISMVIFNSYVTNYQWVFVYVYILYTGILRLGPPTEHWYILLISWRFWVMTCSDLIHKSWWPVGCRLYPVVSLKVLVPAMPPSIDAHGWMTSTWEFLQVLEFGKIWYWTGLILIDGLQSDTQDFKLLFCIASRQSWCEQKLCQLSAAFQAF